jgi:hypothetical protein
MPQAATHRKLGEALGRTPAMFFLVVSLIVALSAYGGLSDVSNNGTSGTTSTQIPSSQATIYIQVVNESTLMPIVGMTVDAGPAKSPNDVSFTPGGPTLLECVHEVPSGSFVEENGSVIFPNGTMITSPPCPLKQYVTDSAGRVSILNATGAYYFISAGNVISWNYIVVAMNGTKILYVTIPWPSGKISLASVSTVTHTVIVNEQSSTFSSCTGYPPGGNCLATYSYTFTISVNYSGPWMLTYQGYNSLGKYNPLNVSGNFTGSGFYSKDVTLSGLNNSGLTLCAWAQKLDGSNSTLILMVTGYNETSLPYGSTSYCGGVVP